MPTHKTARRLEEDKRSGPTAVGAAEPQPITTHATPVVGRAFASGPDPLGGTVADDTVSAALTRRRGSGARLPSRVADSFGEQFGTDFSDVRVHADGEADRVARSIQATAFTHGNDIYFAAGSYAPRTEQGQHVLAHELTHVVQQRGAGAATGGRAPVIGRADDPAEHEAEAVASRVVPALRRKLDPLLRQTRPAPVEVQRLFGFGE